MARLEDLTKGAAIKGVQPDQTVTVVDVAWHGSAVVEQTYRDPAGRVDHELVYRDREPTLEVRSRPLSFECRFRDCVHAVEYLPLDGLGQLTGLSGEREIARSTTYRSARIC